jgi:hypothetical protein
MHGVGRYPAEEAVILPVDFWLVTALQILAPFVLALGFRLRGAAVFQRVTGRGATTARIVCFAIPCGLIGWGLGLPWHWSLALGVAAWLGCLPPWWGSLDLARQYGEFREDFLLHTMRGVIWIWPMAVVLAHSGHLEGAYYLTWAGLLCGAVYEAGYRIREAHGAELGEAFFGFLIGAALVAGIS